MRLLLRPSVLSDRLILVYASAALFLILTSVDRLLQVRGLLPISMYPLACAVLAPLFLYALLRSVDARRERTVLGALANTKAVLFSFAALSLIVLIGAAFPGASFDKRGEFLKPLFMLCILVFSVALGTLPVVIRHYRLILFIAFSGLVASILIDVVRPGTFSNMQSRAAGFGQNPTLAAHVVVLLSTALVHWQRPRATDLLLWGIAAATVFCTLCRADVLVLGVAFVAYVARALYARRFLLGHWAVGVACALLLIAAGPRLTEFFSESEMFNRRNARIRIQFLSTPSKWSVSQLANEARVSLLTEYMGYVAQRPILGHGTGFSTANGRGAHNLYVHYWTDNGVIGLACVALFLASCLAHFLRRRHAVGLVFVLVLMFYGVFGHNLLEQRSIVTLIGLLASLALHRRAAQAAETETAAVNRAALAWR